MVVVVFLGGGGGGGGELGSTKTESKVGKKLTNSSTGTGVTNKHHLVVENNINRLIVSSWGGEGGFRFGFTFSLCLFTKNLKRKEKRFHIVDGGVTPAEI